MLGHFGLYFPSGKRISNMRDYTDTTKFFSRNIFIVTRRKNYKFTYILTVPTMRRVVNFDVIRSGHWRLTELLPQRAVSGPH